MLRRLFVAAATGALTVSVAWAGAGLGPVDRLTDDTPIEGATEDLPQPGTEVEARAEALTSVGDGPLEPGWHLVGAAKVSIEPDPEAFGGEWNTEGCATFGDDSDRALDHVADFRVRWPEDPNCIYMGGYGIGPMNPITSWNEEHGLWVRSVAIGDGTDTFVLTILDGTSYFGEYGSMCAEGDRCGAFALAEDLGAELGIDPAGLLFASTHSHTAPDFIGGWGGVPEWYMAQVTEALRTSVREAVAAMEPALVETGEVIVRERNGERRDFYRSAEEQTLAWFRAFVPGQSTTTAPGRSLGRGEGDGANETTTTTTDRVIATVGAYAAHPVTADEATGIADADFPVVFDARVEEAFGGVGLLFQTGLGNMSPRGSTVEMGEGLAAAVPAVGAGRPLATTDVRVAQSFWDQPITNSGLTALGTPGFFDRPFGGPAAVSAGKSDSRPCTSSSATSVRTAVSAARIGDGLVVTGGPGETFANLSNSVKERVPHAVALPLAQVNDGLGYIMQSFETDHAGRQALGFVGDPFAEYEDAYSIDACFGDVVLERTIGLLGDLG
ncbi:MAG: hypothetical protein ACRDUY_04425 [Nitriliruptorales bacterium]